MNDNQTTETTTDRLRALLDERGVEHYDGAERTLWGYEPTGEDTGIYRYAASEISGGFLQFDMFRVTPEQAIAATLGSETCENANTDGYSFRFECSKCGYGSITTNCRTRNDELPRFCPNCGRRTVKR